MSEEKNIDKLFKERLKDFEKSPDDAVWKHIEAELNKEERERRVIPIWWKFAGVAATLLLLVTVASTFMNNGHESKVVDTETFNGKTIKEDTTPKRLELHNLEDIKPQSVAHQEDKLTEGGHTNVKNNGPASYLSNKNSTTSEDNTTTERLKTNSDKAKATVTKKSEQPSSIVSQTSTRSNNSQSALKKDNRALKNAIVTTSKATITQQQTIEKESHQEKTETDKLIKQKSTQTITQATGTVAFDKEKNTSSIDSSKIKIVGPLDNAIEQAIAKQESSKTIKDSTSNLSKRWSLAPNMAPVYFNTLGNGSSIDEQFVDNSKEGNINVSYGLKGAYAISKKLTIRAGVNKVDLGYSTNNIVAFAESNTATLGRALQNVDIKEPSSTFISANTMSFDSGPEILFLKEKGSIDQELGFIEVPIEIEYNILDTKIGLNLIGGFSTLFLNDNDVYSVQNNGSRTRLGEASNINDMSYSANFGIGVNYNISKQLRFNLEPTFKYQINTFNDTSGNFQPFFIGVYTGLSFKF